MGVKNLNKLIQQHAPETHRPFRMHLLHNKRIGIDAFCWLYELKFRIRNNKKSFETNFIEKLFSILSQKPALVYFVFDGRPPEEKRETLLRRKDEKKKLSPDQKIKLTAEDMDVYKKSIRKTRNNAILNSHDEAEATLARLEQEGHIDFIFSSDTDILPLGSSYIFRNKNNLWIYADVVLLKKKLGITQCQLVDLCVILGNDFNASLRRVGPTTAIELIQKHKSLENILQNVAKYKDIAGTTAKRMLRTKELFRNVLGDYKICMSHDSK